MSNLIRRSGDCKRAFRRRILLNFTVAFIRPCRDLAMDTLLFLYDFDVALHNDPVPTPLFVRPRIPHDMMFVIGGWTSGRATHLIESYDTKADRWIKVLSLDNSIAVPFSNADKGGRSTPESRLMRFSQSHQL